MIKWLFSLLVFTSTTANAAEYYFSAAGNDASGNGSANAPWQSVSKMNSVMLTMAPGDKVLLKRGDVFFGTIVVNQSGSEAKPIVIGAYGSGNLPVVTGLTTVSGWSAKGKGIYEKVLTPAPSGNLNLVIVKGVLQPLGRFPKAGAGNDSYLYIGSHTASTQITSDGIARLPDFTGAQVVQRKIQWIIDRAILTRQTANTLTLQPEVSPDHPTVTYESVNGHGFFFQNHINAVKNPGDWCYDKISNKLSMYFDGGGPQRTPVQAAVLSQLLTINNKRFITVENINFRGANENIVQLNAASNCTFSNCTFEWGGINGIDVERSSVYNTQHNTHNQLQLLKHQQQCTKPGRKHPLEN